MFFLVGVCNVGERERERDDDDGGGECLIENGIRNEKDIYIYMGN